MKRYIFLLGLFGFAALFEACNDFDNTFDFAPKVQFSIGDTTIFESELSIPVDVQLVGPQLNSPVTVAWEVSGSALVDRDYSITDNSNSVTIPANSSTASFTIDILNDAAFLEDTVLLVLTIVSATEGISPGREGEDRKQLTVTIIEDDCSIDWIEGVYDVVTTNTVPSLCENTTNVVRVTQVNETTYEFGDITGGVYKNCFNRADNPGQLILENGVLKLIDQPDVVIGGDIFNGEGQMETCEQTISLTWSNGFGDRGTSLMRRRN